MRESKNLILIGFKSAGKTLFGALLAKELNKPFIDTDKLVEKLYFEKYQAKKSCREIALTHGLFAFRSLENQVIASLYGTVNSIIATGGGTLLHVENLQILQSLGPLIYLQADQETLKQRILSNSEKSIYDSQNFDTTFLERLPLYENAAAYRLHTENKSSEEILAELKTVVR